MSKRVIIITGGGSGIGKETALILASQGVQLIIADMNIDGAKSVAQEIKDNGGEAEAFKVDVSNEQQVQEMVDFTIEQFGTVTGIFNNAGIGLVRPLLEMETKEYQKVIEVDQYSIFYGTKLVAKKMVELGVKNGVIVNTASIYGYSAGMGSFNYNAAKSAVVAMTRTGALELAAHNIRVVAVAPGFIDTPILAGLDDATKQYLANQHMRKALLKPKQVGEVVSFLFSDAASGVNGSTIPVDDGFLAFK
jgi:NAD(P)-dependent dehydrogenase (short-subunit alcohol dehydrogenase family)